MTLHIELTPEQEARLNAVADQTGIAPVDVLKRLVDEHLPPVATNGASGDPTIALFEQWEQEDAQKSADAAAEEDRLWEAFEQGINETRRAQGMREL